MNIFFTSDMFFGRRLKALERGFTSEEEMKDVYIENWNRRVGKGDLVYHLGNFSWDPIACEDSMIHLNGKIIFLSGPYDSHLSSRSLIKLNKHALINTPILTIPNINCVISHWPLLDWPMRDKDYIHIHGGDEASSIGKESRFNANISHWDNSPIELDLFKDLIEIKKETNI